MISARAFASFLVLSLSAGSIGCTEKSDTISAVEPPIEDELVASDGRLEIFEEAGGWSVAITDAASTRLLVMTERFADRGAAEAGGASLLGYASVGYAFFARPVDGKWVVELLHAGRAIATTAAYEEEASARRDVSKARALMRALPLSPAAVAAYGQLRFALSKVDGKVSFVLRGRDGATLLRSEAYASLASALRGIDNVFLYADSGDPRFAVNAEAGKQRLSLVAYNGQTIGLGDLFETEADAQRAAGAITALVDDGAIPTVVE